MGKALGFAGAQVPGVWLAGNSAAIRKVSGLPRVAGPGHRQGLPVQA